MKKQLLATAIALASVSGVISGAHAADGTINFTGEVLDAACTVDVGATSALTVDLGKVQKSAFSGDGSTAAATKFTLKLSACPESVTSATVKFDGTAFAGDNTVLALTSGTGVATGVGIQLMDATNTVVPLFTASSAYTLTTDAENDLDFYARYIQKGDTIAAGKADATASFTIDYQ